MHSLPHGQMLRQSIPSLAQPSFPAEETRILAQPRPVSRVTMAPAPIQAQPPDAAALRATLPGSRMTDPPYPPPQPERSSRLWIVIAILLIIMLFAAIALLRYLQIVQTAPLH